MVEQDARRELQGMGISRGIDDDRSCLQIIQDLEQRDLEVIPTEPVGEIVTSPRKLLKSYIRQIPVRERRPYFAP